MTIDDIKFVELPSSSYYAFIYSNPSELNSEGTEFSDEKRTLSISDENVWKFDPDKAVDFYRLGKLDKEGRRIGDTFSWDERLFTGPDMKTIFKWIIVDGIKFYVVEEIPRHLLGLYYRYQYKLIPVEQKLKELGFETEKTSESVLQEGSI
jgi:hypothetical protein